MEKRNRPDIPIEYVACTCINREIFIFGVGKHQKINLNYFPRNLTNFPLNKLRLGRKKVSPGPLSDASLFLKEIQDPV
jgi:hypothetical protein